LNINIDLIIVKIVENELRKYIVQD